VLVYNFANGNDVIIELMSWDYPIDDYGNVHWEFALYRTNTN
jgi:hypothetical protein